MTELHHIIIASLVCTGIRVCMMEGNILFPIRQLLDALLNNRYGVWIGSPLYQCLPCMASIHGSWIYFAICTELNFFLFIFALCALNYVIDIHIDTE